MIPTFGWFFLFVVVGVMLGLRIGTKSDSERKVD
jgi:hypothetical protein